jgi:hypothetical protein
MRHSNLEDRWGEECRVREVEELEYYLKCYCMCIHPKYTIAWTINQTPDHMIKGTKTLTTWTNSLLVEKKN